MSYQHWFVSRQKRRLAPILDALIAFSDLCVGEKWAGNTALQLQLEDALGSRDITQHGGLRARRENSGGGGVRTLFKQLKDLGLIFLEDDTGKARLTLIGESLVRGDISLVEAMRIQLMRYQYPSAATYKGSGSVDPSFRVHPFQFMLRLMRCPELNNKITMNEMKKIIIHHAKSDSQDCLEDVKNRILRYRMGDYSSLIEDDSKGTYSNIANTMFNYLSVLQFTDRGNQFISIRNGKEQAVDALIEKISPFIPHPELQENYQRKFGRGLASRDLRDFSTEPVLSRTELTNRRIRNEYALLKLGTPILSITPEVVNEISRKTGEDPNQVYNVLSECFPSGSVDDFFLNYRELAKGGTATARDFELATCEMFKNIFGMRTEHVGPMGNTPDVFIESPDGWCGIIDNKAYKHGYSIVGDHKRRMMDVYIPNYTEYGHTNVPLAFFNYIAPSFCSSINTQLAEITRATGVAGSAIPVDLMINFAQDYAHGEYDHDKVKEVFTVNRLIELADIQE